MFKLWGFCFGVVGGSCDLGVVDLALVSWWGSCGAIWWRART